MAEDLVKAIADLHDEQALRITKERLGTGEDPLKLLEDTRNAMKIVGKRFEDGEYFLPELIYSEEILREVAEIIKPKLKGAVETKLLGKVIIGTVHGDIHDIGKNIVSFMLDVNGFEVYDLGIDVPAEKFVEKIKETSAEIVGLSGFLTLAFDSMKETIEAIREAGLREKVRIMIGGGQINDELRKYTDADAYGPNAVSAVSLAKEWTGGE